MKRRNVRERQRIRGSAIAIAALFAITASACGGDDGDNSSSDTTTAATTQTTAAPAGDTTTTAASATPAVPTGSVKIAYPVGPVGLHPHRQALVIDPIATFLIYDRLLQIDSDSFEIKPMLATEWKFESGSLALTLRDDVKFNDGEVFDAAAVKANIDSQLTSDKSTTKPLLAAITAVEVVDATHVKLALKPGQGSEMLANLATHAGAMISPKALADTTADLAKTPGMSGSGAYVVTEYDPTTHISFKHADQPYWDTSAGKLANIEIVVIAKTSGRLDAVRTGEADVAHLQLPEAKDAIDLAKSGDFDVFKIENFLSAHDTIFNTSDARLADVRVRQALAYAVDREGIAAGLLNNGCTVTPQLYPSTHWAASSTITGYTYDPAKAKDLLAQAGVTNLKLEVGFPTGTPFELLATAIKDQWKAIGVEAELKPYATSADANKAFLAGEFPVFQSAIVGVPEPDTLLRNYYLGGYNLIKDAATKATVESDAVAAVNPALDLKGRAAAYDKIWKTISDQVWNIRICRTFQTYAYNPKVSGVDDMGLVYSGFFDARPLSIEE